MRIQLIHPPIYVNLKAVQATRPSLPLGLAYVAAALREDGHEVSILDAVMAKPEQITEDGRLHYYGLRPEEVAEAADPTAEAFGISVLFSFTWPIARRIIQCLKERYPETPIVGGGEHFTGMPEYSLNSSPIDCIVLGEGESTARELFRAMEQGSPDWSAIPGLAFRHNGKMLKTPGRPRILDVDTLPWPAWDLFDPPAYYRHGHVMGIDRGMTMPMLATRGCPYACTYCSNAMMWQRRWCAREPKDVVDEIAQYHRVYGAMNFPFHDLTAILKKEWIVAFCEELLRRELKISWQLPIGTRCEVIDDDVTRLLCATGCHMVTFAPESGSERTRKLVGKRMTEASLMRAVRASVRNRLTVTNFFVAGFPHDTSADLRQSVRLAFRLAVAGAHDIALSIFFPIPGSQLYDELVASGRIVPSDEVLLAPIFSMDAKLREENNFCRALSARTITRMKYAVLLTFYLTQFAVRPWRVFGLLWNVLHAREQTRLGVFLINRKKS